MSTSTLTPPVKSVQALEAEHILQVYRRTPVVFERGEGTRLWAGAQTDIA